MRNLYRQAIERGWLKPVRFKRGEALNVWAEPVQDLADRAFAMQSDISPALRDLLCDIFEEIGQRERDNYEVVMDITREANP